MNVFTYDTLMFDRGWSKVVNECYERIDGRLYGYVRMKVKEETFPGLVPGEKRAYIDEKIYRGINNNDIKRLDNFEGEYFQIKVKKIE